MRTQLCPTLCDPMDYPRGSSVYEILQARILEWVAFPFSRGSSRPREWTHVSCVSCMGSWVLYHWATWEAPSAVLLLLFSHQVMSNSSRPHELQHTRLPRPSPSPGVCPSSFPLNRWCHPPFSSSVTLFSFCLQSFPATGSFLMS